MGLWRFPKMGVPQDHSKLDHLKNWYPWWLGRSQKWGTPKIIQNWLSGWWFQPLWKIWKSVGMIIPNIWKKTCSKPPTSYYRKTNGLGYQYPTFQCPKTAFFTGQGSKKPSRHSHRKVPASSIRRLLRVSWPAHFWPRDIIIWLVVSTPLKNMKVSWVSWDYYSEYMEK